MPPILERPLPAPPEPRMSLAARLLNVFAIPGDVFSEVKISRAKAVNWLVPASLFLCVSWVAAWLVFSQDQVKEQIRQYTEQTIQKQVDQGRMSDTEAERARRYAVSGAQLVAYTGPALVAFAAPFWWGLILWLVGRKIFRSDFSYLKAVEVSGLAGMIGVLQVAVKTLLIVGLNNPFASTSAALLANGDDPQNATFRLLSLVDVMAFWLLAVRAIGLARLAEVPFARAAIWVFGVWALTTGLLLGLGFAMHAGFGG